jgi:peptidoglycan hydrolase-like protein with peptidoglycan-binding domain
LDSSAPRSSMDSMRSSAINGQRSPQEVRSVQEALKDKGHDPGPIDGVMGPRTQQALRAFQRAQNIQTSGQLDSSTASALGVTLSSSGGSTPEGSSRGGSTSGSLNSGTSKGAANRDNVTIEPNDGNPKHGGSIKSGSTPGSSSRGSSGTGSLGSGSSSGPNRDSTTLEPTEGNPGSGGTPRSSGSGSSSDSGKSGSSK